ASRPETRTSGRQELCEISPAAFREFLQDGREEIALAVKLVRLGGIDKPKIWIMQGDDYFDPDSSTDLPLLTRTQARLVIALTALILLLIQAALMLYMRNGLVPPGLGDRYTEANVVRAADYFVHEGFAKTVGLPNVVWSPRFPDAGTVAEPESL